MHVRRWVAALVFVLVAGLTLAPAIGVRAQDVTLTFWSWRTEDVGPYEQFIAAFEAENPGIRVRFVPYRNTEYNTIIATALQAGSGPDIVHLRAYGGMEPLAQAGYLMPLDGLVEELERFSPDVLPGATNRADGRIYGVPFAIQTVQVLYNVRIFEELGLEEPQTWDEFLQVAQALKSAGYIPFANGGKEGWTLETFFGAVAPTYYGGSEFYREVVAGETTFEDPRFKAALEKMLELRPYLPDNFMGIGYTDMQALFSQEMAGMMLAGSYELGNFAQWNPDLRVGAFPVPPERPGDPSYISIYMDGSYGINAATRHPEEALKFIRFLASQEYGQMFTDTLKQLSAVPGTVPTDPVLAELVEMMEAHGTPYVMLTAFRYGQPSGSTLLQNELQALFADILTVDEVAANIQRGLETWYEPFQ